MKKIFFCVFMICLIIPAAAQSDAAAQSKQSAAKSALATKAEYDETAKTAARDAFNAGSSITYDKEADSYQWEHEQEPISVPAADNTFGGGNKNKAASSGSKGNKKTSSGSKKETAVKTPTSEEIMAEKRKQFKTFEAGASLHLTDGEKPIPNLYGAASSSTGAGASASRSEESSQTQEGQNTQPAKKVIRKPRSGYAPGVASINVDPSTLKQ